MEKTIYSTTMSNLKNIYLYQKYQKENSIPKILTTPVKIQEVNNLTPEKLKEGKWAYTHAH